MTKELLLAATAAALCRLLHNHPLARQNRPPLVVDSRVTRSDCVASRLPWSSIMVSSVTTWPRPTSLPPHSLHRPPGGPPHGEPLPAKVRPNIRRSGGGVRRPLEGTMGYICGTCQLRHCEACNWG